jgi:homoserine dehydrogenase
MRAPFRVGVLGLGHVGGALARRLSEDADWIASAAGRPIALAGIAVAHPERRSAPAPMLPAERLLEDAQLDAIVELIGGREPAHTYIHTALTGGRQVITANKQVIAADGPELARLGPLRFEAAVASAIPIVETLAETLAADRIMAVTGILNGTTNAILEAMGEGVAYGDALADAQGRGLAEADPSADVDAHDPAAKLAIIAMLAFRQRVDPVGIIRVGIRGLGAAQLRDARASGRVVKLIAAARLRNGPGLEADVRPRLIPIEAPMARVDGAQNAIAVDATYAGTLFLQGPGAGPDAAASAVVADLVRAARDIPASAGALLARLAREPAAAIAPVGMEFPYAASR